MRPIQDQVVVVTGASSGLGRETALQFARKGARLVLAARNREALDTLAEEIRQLGQRAIAVPTDVTDFHAVEALAERAVETYGRIDTWINNAGVALYATFEQTELDESRRVMDVIYWGNFHGIKAALPRLRESGGGVIICVGSLLSELVVPLQSSYCASKHALRALVEAVRIELAQRKEPISLVLLKPPSMDTPLFRHARSKTGYFPKPVSPIYDPKVIARDLVACAQRPEREVRESGLGPLIIWAHQYFPRAYDRILVWRGVRMQMTRKPRTSETPDNLFAPLTERGNIRETQRGLQGSWTGWLGRHRWIIGLVLGFLAAGCFQFDAESRRRQ